MLMEIKESDYYEYYREMERRHKKPFIRLLALAITGLALGAICIVAGQWIASIMLLIFILGLLYSFQNSYKIKAENGIRKKAYIGQMEVGVDNSEIVIKQYQSLFRISFHDIKEMADLENYLHFEHTLGFNFFLPKSGFSNTELQMVKAIPCNMN